MAECMTLEIVTHKKTIVSRNDITSIVVPGISGSFGVLSHHANMLTALAKGTIEYKAGEELNRINVDGGFVDISNNHVIILVSKLLSEDEFSEE